MYKNRQEAGTKALSTYEKTIAKRRKIWYSYIKSIKGENFMKKTTLRILSLCLLICLLLGSLVTEASASYYDFGLHYNEEGYAWAEWIDMNNGIDFRVKVKNYSDTDFISGYTIAFSCKNKYDEPILLKDVKGEWHDTPLLITSTTSYKPGRVAFSEFFRLYSKEEIKYVTATIVSYQVKGKGLVEIDPYDYESVTWVFD